MDVSRAKGLELSSRMPTHSHCLLGESCFLEEGRRRVGGMGRRGRWKMRRRVKEKGKMDGERGEWERKKEREKVKGNRKGKEKGKGKGKGKREKEKGKGGKENEKREKGKRKSSFRPLHISHWLFLQIPPAAHRDMSCPGASWGSR